MWPGAGPLAATAGRNESSIAIGELVVQLNGRAGDGGSRLNDTEKAVLLEIVGGSSSLRSTLSERLSLSKATVFGAVKRLQQAGLVVAYDTIQVGAGRPASVLRAAVEAGANLGLDLGTTCVRIRAAALDGRVLAEAERPVRPSNAEIGNGAVRAACSLATTTGEVLRALGAPVRSCVVAAPIRVQVGEPLPTRLDPVLDALGSMPAHRDFHVEVENNVNCAAVAEGAVGVASGCETFALLQVGVKIGLGVIYEGQLFRGGRGGAGEVAYLPFPWLPDQPARRMSLETYLGSSSLADRANAAANLNRRGSLDAKSLFALADGGDLSALRFVQAYAREIGRLAAAVVAVIDPPLVVLGGGVGQNPMLLEGVRETVGELTWETAVETGVLGQRATVLGAAELALRSSLAQVLAASYR
ncbi:MAG TPA: ROK family transcriptional regulator [Acidimicrobiales bacterium]|nr:ROK family transcriptional regulator [Acidimicrobiales bacterium]